MQAPSVAVEGLAAAGEGMELDGTGVRVNLVDAAGAAVGHVAGGEKNFILLVPGEPLGDQSILQTGIAGDGGAAGKGVVVGHLSVGQEGYPGQEKDEGDNQDDADNDFQRRGACSHGSIVSGRAGCVQKKMPPCQNEAASWENRSSKGGVWHGGGGRPPRRRWLA